MACYLNNRSLCASLEGSVADKVWTSNPIDLDNLRIFKCPAYMHISREDRSKLDLNSKKFVFVGYAKDVKWFMLYDLIKKKMLFLMSISC